MNLDLVTLREGLFNSSHSLILWSSSFISISASSLCAFVKLLIVLNKVVSSA